MTAGRLELALSPYHLATREAPAMLALTLGTRVVTLMPTPAAGTSREAVKQAVEESPRYLRLMEAWRWSGPLWQSGVIVSGVSGDEAAAELEGVYALIASEEGLSPLRPLTRGASERATSEPEKALDAIAGDVLRGGADPGINIPITAALDRFAIAYGLCVVRGGTPSLTQRAESRLGQKVFSMAMPVLLRAGGGRLERMREDLKKELGSLRRSVAGVFGRVRESDEEPGPRRETDPEIGAACAAFVRAFELWAADGAAGDDENGERVTAGYVSVSGVVMPGDAALRASRAAVCAMGARGEGRGAAATGGAKIPGSEDRLFSLVVRELNLKPAQA